MSGRNDRGSQILAFDMLRTSQRHPPGSCPMSGRGYHDPGSGFQGQSRQKFPRFFLHRISQL